MIDDILHYRDEHGTVTGGKMKLKKEKWEQHKSGKYNWSSQLWSILMFQSWLEQQGDVR